MNYHVHHQGQDLGIRSGEELRRQRDSGELSGDTLLWAPGMATWQPLDAVFPAPNPPPVLGHPPGPSAAASAGTRSNPIRLWITIGVAVVLGFLGLVLLAAGFLFRSHSPGQVAEAESSPAPDFEDAEEIASRPIRVSTNSTTQFARNAQARAFRAQQYLDAYRKHADRTSPTHADGALLVENWIADNYGGPRPTNAPSNATLADPLARNPDFRDPVALLVTALECPEQHERTRRLERAVAAFEGSGYGPYPRFYATVSLADALFQQPERKAALDTEAVGHFGSLFGPEGLRASDQAQLAETLLHGWGENFYSRNRTALHGLRDRMGPDFQWLSLVLEGEFELKEGWAARGDGFAGTVTDDGWKAFQRHSEKAGKALTAAWKLRPDLPQAPARMIHVALGSSGAEEMRTWFDRTLDAQIDYPDAWKQMRWGLRPRWHGSVEALLKLGTTAVDTGRFDTDVPRKLFDCIEDAESELSLAPGRRIFGRSQVWPDLERMYRGYIGSKDRESEIRGWRTAFAVVARFAGKYQVAREQMEALDWKPNAGNLQGWDADLSMFVPEVAARSGAAAREVVQAEKAREEGHPLQAIDLFTAIADRTDLDVRTRDYARHLLSLMAVEQRLARGESVSFLPGSTNDAHWVNLGGEVLASDGRRMDVRSGNSGHLLYNRVDVGTNFAVRGEWEVVSTSNGDFQAGIVFGHPDRTRNHWLGFRMKNTKDEGQVASVSRAWSRTQIVGPAPVLPGRTNRFEFEFRNGLVTLTVNDHTVFRDNPFHRYPEINPAEFRVGVGAFNDMNDTVIRYRNVEIRRL
jgi:hypothetical protein